MKKFLLAFGIILALAFSVTAATTNFNATTATTEVEGDCDKCNKKDCKGDCTATKACCKKGEGKSCSKKAESKKACTGKKECKKGEKAACHSKTEGEKKACAHHKK